MADPRSRDRSGSNSGGIISKCDFCDVTFKCDIDASRHLSSASHNNKRDSFMSLQNLRDKELEKQIPKNLLQVLQLLKIRSVKDLKDLTDKGYFELQNESLAGIADEFAKTLVKAVITHECRNLPENERNFILSNLQGTKSPSPVATTSAHQDQPRRSSPISVTQPQVQNHQDPASVEQELLMQSRVADPVQPAPFNPQPARTGLVQAAQSQVRHPPQAQVKEATNGSRSTPFSHAQPRDSLSASASMTHPVKPSGPLRTPDSAARQSTLTGAPGSIREPKPARAPEPIIQPISTRAPGPNRHPGPTRPTMPNRAPTAQPPPAVVRPIRPLGRAQSSQQTSSVSYVASATQVQARSMPQARAPSQASIPAQPQAPTQPQSQQQQKQPHPQQQPTTNTVGPRQAVPRASNYIPKLSIVKVEPKDN